MFEIVEGTGGEVERLDIARSSLGGKLRDSVEMILRTLDGFLEMSTLVL